MLETKKRQFAISLTDGELKAFIEKCYTDKTTPAEVLEGFICDLTGTERTRGKNERILARQYYECCGYGFFFPEEERNFTFVQWLLNENVLEPVLEALDDIETLEKEKELEDQEAELENRREELHSYYRDYVKSVKKYEPLEKGIEGIREYINTIDTAMKGARYERRKTPRRKTT